MTEYCAVIGPALYRAAQQTAVKEVTRPLPSLAERGVATRDQAIHGSSLDNHFWLLHQNSFGFPGGGGDHFWQPKSDHDF